jgi:hypothetical protein
MTFVRGGADGVPAWVEYVAVRRPPPHATTT